ncbi:MAG: ester cyclase [Pseudomonadota bacterium]
MKRKVIMLFAAAAIAASALPAQANDAMRSVVEPFYTKILTRASGADVAATAEAIISENWESIGNYSDKAKSRDEFVKQMIGFGQLIPDMTWNIEEMIISDNRVIVRGRATGTPQGPLFGIDGKGKSWEIMSIDIHTVEDGKIVTSYHVEDWAGAIRQLKAE